jgi:hypothetical protein
MTTRCFFDFSVKSPLLTIFDWSRFIYATKAIVCTLVVSVPVTIGDCAAESGYAAAEAAGGRVQTEETASDTRGRAGNEEYRRKIRKENDAKSKAREPFYPQQAASLAKQYKETAGIVAREGGDPQPLLDAAAYYERQSE